MAVAAQANSTAPGGNATAGNATMAVASSPTTENGQAALEYLLPSADRPLPATPPFGGRGGHCHLVLSDLMMPVMDGYELVDKLKSIDATRHLPVIMLTARAEARDKLKALRIGVDELPHLNVLHQVRGDGADT